MVKTEDLVNKGVGGQHRIKTGERLSPNLQMNETETHHNLVRTYSNLFRLIQSKSTTPSNRDEIEIIILSYYDTRDKIYETLSRISRAGLFFLKTN